MKKIRGLCLPVMLGAVLMSQHVHAADNLTFKGNEVASKTDYSCLYCTKC